VDLHDLVDPSTTALVTVEVQEGVVGGASVVPALAEAAAPVLPRIAALARAARAVGVPVVHCTVDARADGRGGNRNARLFRRLTAPSPSLDGRIHRGVVHPAVEPDDGDLVLGRLHGVSPMTAASLDPVLRNLGVRTIVATGVSVNVAVLGLAFEAVNHGYELVVPRDAVAGVDEAYVDAVFRRTLALLGTVTTVDELVGAWSAPAPARR
jgi:nicotinamidase-related amidase